MITYQVRERTFRIGDRHPPRLPADVVLRVLFGPSQPFGGEGYGRAVVLEGQVLITFNANTGQHLVESKPRLEPLEVVITDPERAYRLNGPELEVRSRFESLDELHEFIQSLVLGLPWLLNIEFPDPPYVERVNGEIGGTPFVWELKQWGAQFAITTNELQEKKFADSFMRLAVVARPGRRRLLAALHYFHRACRLDRAAMTAGEFMAEALLNYSKVLEVLFPGEKGVETMDAARAGLRELGYSDSEIERDFIPCMALRSHIDVAHVYLGVFSTKQLTTLHQYAESSELKFRQMFERALKAIEEERWDVSPYDLADPDARVVRIIEEISKNRVARPNKGGS